MFSYSGSCISFPSCYGVKWSLLAEYIHPHSSDIAWISQFILPSFLRVTFHCIPKTKDPWGWSAKTLIGWYAVFQEACSSISISHKVVQTKHLATVGRSWGHSFLLLCVSFPVVTRSTWAWQDEDTVAGCSSQQTSWVLSLDPQFMSLSIPLHLS